MYVPWTLLLVVGATQVAVDGRADVDFDNFGSYDYDPITFNVGGTTDVRPTKTEERRKDIKLGTWYNSTDLFKVLTALTPTITKIEGYTTINIESSVMESTDTLQIQPVNTKTTISLWDTTQKITTVTEDTKNYNISYTTEITTDNITEFKTTLTETETANDTQTDTQTETQTDTTTAIPSTFFTIDNSTSTVFYNITDTAMSTDLISEEIETTKSKEFILKQAKIREDTTFETVTEIIDTTPEQPVLNVPALLKIIGNLTGDMESKLAKQINETFQKMSLPTCGRTYETTTSQYDANYTGTLVAKCFVCGLDVERVPNHAHCADAFAGDFLPLVPVDPTAKAQISKYRKYCKYSNERGYSLNTTQPRAIFGRWTGGCGVRWIDLSGIYTQRVCRNRLQPTVGRHFASKRMAKLEKTLWNVDNGCIVSPMATLVPLSRAISLYARFHACVCTGSWCNRAIQNAQVTSLYMFVSFFVVHLLQIKFYK